MHTKEKRFGSLVNKSIYFANRLNEIGLSNKYTGYYYLIKILDIVVNGEIKVKSYSRQVYPSVALSFNTSVCTIERNIRSLIKNCWSDEIAKRLRFKNVKRPTCCRLISLIVKNIFENIS